MPELQVSNVGPVADLVIELNPGVNVLRGHNGSGKSTVINGVSRLLGGDANGLSTKDGEKRGEISLGDATLTVTRSRTAVRGEIEIVGIESRLDISSLVDPGVADAEKADAKRIKALISLAGVRANPTIFYDAVGGADEYAKLGVDESTPDILLLGARVKRAAEAKAREFEESAEQYTASARALEKAVEGVDLGAEADERKLADEFAAASARVTALESHNEAVAAAREAAEQAKATLAEMAASADDVAVLQEKSDAARASHNALVNEIAAIDAQIAELQKQRHDHEMERRSTAELAEHLGERIVRAKEAESHRAKLAAQAEAAVAAPHPAGKIAEAQAAVTKAEEAIARGAAVRLARAQAEEARTKGALGKNSTKAGQTWRRAAAAVDDALTALLPSDCPLRVEAGRLVIETDRGKSEPYAELSLGEKWLVALRFAAKQLPPGGLLTLDQTAWESLQPSNRQLIADEATRLGISILTAEAADSPLSVEHLRGAAASVN